MSYGFDPDVGDELVHIDEGANVEANMIMRNSRDARSHAIIDYNRTLD